MTAPLCLGRPPEWWYSTDDGARLAMAICRQCPDQAVCRDEDPQPFGVIRGGVAFNDDGNPYPICPTCGYPNTRAGFGRADQCPRCDVPSLSRWRSDILRWAADGVRDAQAATWIGSTRVQVAKFRRAQTSSAGRGAA